MARVLVLSDEPETSERAERFLRGQGHDVACVCSVEEASQSIAAAVPDLVIADCAILGEQGAVRAARAVRARGIRMILMTGDTGRTRVMRRPDLPVLEKPPSLLQLAELVGQTLSMGSPQSAAEPSFIDRSLSSVRNLRTAVAERSLRAAGGLFDRYVREYRYKGFRFEIPRELTTPEFRARFLLRRYEVPERAL